MILDSDWLLFVIVDVLKYSNQSGDSLSYGKSNPLEDRRLKSYCKTIIVQACKIKLSLGLMYDLGIKILTSYY